MPLSPCDLANVKCRKLFPFIHNILASFQIFLASPDALEVIVVSYSLTPLLTDLLTVSTDLTDVTLVSDDTYMRLD